MKQFFEIALSQIKGIGPIKAKNLIRYCGSAEAVFTESKARLSRIPDVGDKIIQGIANKEVFIRAEAEIKFTEKNGIKILSFDDPAYPSRLLNCPDHPILLYKKGRADLNQQRVISIVGTRNATSYGKRVVNELIEHLSDKNVSVVSGLAYGIDVEAHKACLKHKLSTVGVVAHGLDRIYPVDHVGIAKAMLQEGAWVSEFMSNTTPEKENFPKRNRLVAGMSDATVVVESKSRGGSMITARLAADYNRDVFAVPGKLIDRSSEGCNRLIREHLAAIYTGPDSMMKSMGWDNSSVKPKQLRLPVDLSENEQHVVRLVQERKKIRRDELSAFVGLPASSIAEVLLSLELKGVTKTYAGGSIGLAFF